MDRKKKYSITESFAGRSVLITGASGFLGKVLVEKLLYAVPDVKKIYLIIRPHRQQQPQQRLKRLLESPIFDRLKREQPEVLNKLIPVNGDLDKEGLGLDPSDVEIICNEVAIVFHCAATVKFDEALKLSLVMNVLGTQRLIALCQDMKNLVCVVHTSTAYANCDKKETLEKVYKTDVLPAHLIEALQWMDEDMMNTISPHVVKQRPNTYTLTKALAENQLIQDAKDLPVIIIRPSIIGAIWKDPLPGWTDNLNGPTGIFAGVGKGAITNMCGSLDAKADIVPVDLVSNMLIAAAAYRINRDFDEIPVMHCTSGELNPIRWGKLVNFLEVYYATYPLNDCLRVPSTYFHTSRPLFLINYYLKHEIPAHLMDYFNILIGKKATFARTYKKVWKLIETLHYFTTRGWKFESQGIITLWESLNKDDKEMFNFDIRQINWDEYIFDYQMGIKRYLLKENLDDLPKARLHLRWLRAYAHIFNFSFWLLMVRLFAWKRTSAQKYSIWATGVVATHMFNNVSFRPAVKLRSLEEYKRIASCP